MAEGLPADAPLPPWFLRDLEANKVKEAEAEREQQREAVRATNPYMLQEGLPKFESITPEASKEVCSLQRRYTPQFVHEAIWGFNRVGGRSCSTP